MVKVIYIAGVGHSGSTILNLLIGSSAKVFSLGETKPLPVFLEEQKTRQRSDQFKCTCGQKVKNCSFWRWFKEDKAGLLSDKVSWTNRFRLMGSVIGKIPSIPCTNGKLYNKMLRQAQKVKGEKVEWLVDSSKDLDLLAHLYHEEDVDLHLIHLVRDSRANISSLEKYGYHWFHGVLFWYYRNILLDAITRKMSSDKAIRITYEEFSQQPMQTIQQLNQRWDISIPEDYVDAIQRESFHNFAGNTMRSKEFTGIYHDDAWKERMPCWKKMIITVLTWLPNKLWH